MSSDIKSVPDPTKKYRRSGKGLSEWTLAISHSRPAAVSELAADLHDMSH